jgi:hypothetical protein
MKPKSSLLHSQEPATDLYPEPVESSPSPPILFLEDIQLSYHLGLGLPSGLLPSRFPNNSCMHLTPVHATCINHILFVLAILILAVGLVYEIL